MQMQEDNFKRGSISHWEKDWAGKKAAFSLTKPVDDWNYFDVFRAEYLEKMLLSDKNILCLECGCGTASTSVYFASKGVKTIMLDASISALKIASENFSNHNLKGEFVNGNMECLPFADDKFDLVMSFGVLEHFENMSLAIKEMVRILKPDGIFFAAVSPKKYSIQLAGNLINTLMRFIYNLKHLRFRDAFLNSYPAAPGFYENSFSSAQYVKVMEKCGLKNVKLSGSRPFPSLNILPSMFKIYIVFMKMLKPLHLLFEMHTSKFTELWGVEWSIIGAKK
ncbi:MAG: class I SAM-dependent methyltransferase [Candidatus Omnitrophica bacterium]|nr:class I SAM-dependent methyltransferase [Candidatus Omnitrophota bacterium]